MNDEYRDAELSSIVTEWSAPTPSAGFRARVLEAYDKKYCQAPWWRRFLPGSWRLLAAALVSAAGLLFVVTGAYPQIAGPSLPPGTKWTVDSEFVHYGDDGSASVDMYATSYGRNSQEFVLSRSVAGNRNGRTLVKSALIGTLDIVLPVWTRFITPFTVDSGTLQKIRRARAEGVSFVTGCSAGCLALDHFGWSKAKANSEGVCIDGPVVDRTTILNHSTEAVRRRWTEHGRMTIWMAPDLGCFALQVTYEAETSAGSFQLVSAKHPLRINPVPFAARPGEQ